MVCILTRFVKYGIIVFILCLFLRVDVTYASEVYYLHQDHLGSTTVITKDGNKVEDVKYYPYGVQRGDDLNTDITEKGFTGQVKDSQTGLYYYNARYYNPLTAKFTQPDTVADQENRYAYVANNPINITDPTGNMMDVGDVGGISEDVSYQFPWDDPKYSYENTGMDPMTAYLYENPTIPFDEILDPDVDYTGVSIDSIRGDYEWIQRLIQYELGLVNPESLGSMLKTMMIGETIQSVPQWAQITGQKLLSFDALMARAYMMQTAPTTKSNPVLTILEAIPTVLSSMPVILKSGGSVVPWKVNGQWEFVAHPWGLRPIVPDPYDHFDITAYESQMRLVPGKIIGAEWGRPCIYVTWWDGPIAVDRSRILSAVYGLGMPIVVDIVSVPSFR